jgi:hypothetical protein
VRVHVGQALIPAGPSGEGDLAIFRTAHVVGIPRASGPGPSSRGRAAGLSLISWASSVLNGPLTCRPRLSAATPLSDGECASKLRDPVHSFDILSETCAIVEPDQCQGSSGAGLMLDGTYEVGVLSWGKGCSQGFPVVFVDLTKEFAWLCNGHGLTSADGVC